MSLITTHVLPAPRAVDPAPESAAAGGGDDDLGRLLMERLVGQAPRLGAQFGAPDPARVRCCWLDDVLPAAVVAAATDGLPTLSAMLRRSDDKERKYVSADLDGLNPLLRTLVRAFARQPVADLVADIIGKRRLEADAKLYNGGLTVMLPGDFMRPHLDNSHDYERKRHREVVLLYYISPNWRDEYGGHLQLWPLGTQGQAQTVPFRSNRLVIMETTEQSWHSIQPIGGPLPRVNLTTYFYAPAAERAPLRLTRFTGWPGESLRALKFDGEFRLRNVAARVIGRRMKRNRHAYNPAGVPDPAPQRQDGGRAATNR